MLNIIKFGYKEVFSNLFNLTHIDFQGIENSIH